MVVERIPCDPVDISPLAQPLTFNCGRTARNRIMKAAMTERVSTFCPDRPDEHGQPTETIINMYEKWGNGGFGLILTGNVAVDPLHLESPGNIVIAKETDSQKSRDLLKRYAKACKADGALAVVQLTHAGRQTPETVNAQPRSASDVQLLGKRKGYGFGKPIPYTEEEIQTEIIDRFTFAAELCREAGFDGIQIHGAHGYLLSQFISPTTNKRSDKYGGPPENRIRLVLEIYDSIRTKIPASTGFLVGLKMNSVEFQENGLETCDAKVMCELIEERGFDFVEMSGGTYEKLGFAHLKDSTKAREAFFLDFTDQIRSSLKRTKMYVTGGFRTAKWMAKVIADGNCDGVGLGRPVTAEPDLPKKILNGEALSAADNKLDQQDYGMTNLAANTQMWQAGRFSLNDLNLITHGLMDLSKREEAENYKLAAKKYLEEIGRLGEELIPVAGVFEYTRSSA